MNLIKFSGPLAAHAVNNNPSNNASEFFRSFSSGFIFVVFSLVVDFVSELIDFVSELFV